MRPPRSLPHRPVSPTDRRLQSHSAVRYRTDVSRVRFASHANDLNALYDRLAEHKEAFRRVQMSKSTATDKVYAGALLFVQRRGH